MKIGMVLWAQFPPDIRVKRQARYLVENGHEVHLICKKKPIDVLPRLKTRESHGTAPLSWDITVRGSRPVLVG